MPEITIKPYLSTKASGFRQLLYAKLVDLCSVSDDPALRFFATPPAVPVWNYASVLAWTESDQIMLALLANDNAMLLAFNDWLERPESETEPIIDAVRNASNNVDPIKAPGSVLNEDAKNATGSNVKRSAPKSSTTSEKPDSLQQ